MPRKQTDRTQPIRIVAIIEGKPFTIALLYTPGAVKEFTRYLTCEYRIQRPGSITEPTQGETDGTY